MLLTECTESQRNSFQFSSTVRDKELELSGGITGNGPCVESVCHLQVTFWCSNAVDTPDDYGEKEAPSPHSLHIAGTSRHDFQHLTSHSIFRKGAEDEHDNGVPQIQSLASSSLLPKNKCHKSTIATDASMPNQVQYYD